VGELERYEVLELRSVVLERCRGLRTPPYAVWHRKSRDNRAAVTAAVMDTT